MARMPFSDKPTAIEIGHPKFLCEQSGPLEDQLKERLRAMFDRVGDVTKAYLLRVAYGGDVGQGVILGLSANARKMHSLVRQIGEIFANLFSRGQHLDIVLLDKDSERDAATVGRPFYVKAPTQPPFAAT